MQTGNLVNTISRAEFDTSLIKEGDLICVDCNLWEAAKRGIVIQAAPERIVFVYHPEIANVVNRQIILANEVCDPAYEYRIRWSRDLKSTEKYTSGDPEAPDPPKGLEEPEDMFRE